MRVVCAALVLLFALPAGAQDSNEELFLKGSRAIRAALTTEDPGRRAELIDEAIAAFRPLLIERPDLIRVRLEFARALFLKGEDEIARDHFEYALAGNPPEAVKANIRRFLRAIRARRRWDASLGFALLPDSNVASGTGKRIIHLYGLPFRLDDKQDKSGVGAHLWGSFEYQWPWTNQVRLITGSSFSVKDYSASKHDDVTAGVQLGPRVLLTPKWEASVLSNLRVNWRGGARYSHDVGATWRTEYSFTPRLRGFGSLSTDKRFYRGSRNNPLNGALLGATIGASYVATSTVRVRGSYSHGRERPGAERWRNESHRVAAGATVLLPRGFTLGGGLEYRWKSYRTHWRPLVIDGSGRRDRTRMVTASVLNRKIEVLGFSPKLVLIHERQGSNAQIYGYDRVRMELQVTRLF